MLADEQARTGLKRTEIERPWAGVDIAREKRRAIGGAKDAVFVGFGDCRVSRMKCASHRSGFGDEYRWGQSSIEGSYQILRRDWRVELEAGDLGESVDAGIGAARPLRKRRLAGNAAKRGLQLALDRRKAGLNLPALKVRAVVGKSELPGLKGSLSLVKVVSGLGRLIQWRRSFKGNGTQERKNAKTENRVVGNRQ